MCAQARRASKLREPPGHSGHLCLDDNLIKLRQMPKSPLLLGSVRGQVRDLCDKLVTTETTTTTTTIPHTGGLGRHLVMTAVGRLGPHHGYLAETANKISKPFIGHWNRVMLVFLLALLSSQTKPTDCSSLLQEFQSSLAAGNLLFEARTSASQQPAYGGLLDIKQAPVSPPPSTLQPTNPLVNYSLPKINQSEISAAAGANNVWPMKDSINRTDGVNSENQNFGQRIGANSDDRPRSSPDVGSLLGRVMRQQTGVSSSADGVHFVPENHASEGEFGERATLSRLAELFPVAKRQLIITKLLRQYRKPRSQPSGEQSSKVKLSPGASSETDDGDKSPESTTTLVPGGNWQPHYELESTTTAFPVTTTTTERASEEEETTTTTSASSTGNGTLKDYHLVKLKPLNDNRTLLSLRLQNHRMDSEESTDKPTSILLAAHEQGSWPLARTTSNRSRLGDGGQQQQQQQHWQASNIEQVIHTGKQASESSGQHGAQEELHDGHAERRATGERLRDHEDRGHWSRDKHGEQRHSGSGRKNAKEGDRWVKDVGHKKHGWKNVYHKEEYANHQKYHDVMLDKDWDNKRAKHSESYHHDRGDKFNGSHSNDLYDSNRHGSKYDYVKGSNWKQHQDDHLVEGDVIRVADESDEATQSASKQRASSDERGAHMTRRPAADHFEPSSSSAEEQVHPDPNGEIDDAAIDQMRDKLNRLSDGTRYTMGPGEERAAPTGGSADQSNSSYATESPDYEEDGVEWSPHNTNIGSHQSINDILKTAKGNGKLYQLVRPYESKRHGAPRGAQEVAATVAPAIESDEEDGEPEPTEKPGDSRKNGLRLKLELDLSKAIPASAAAVAASSKAKRNHTLSSPPEQILMVPTHGPLQLQQAMPRNYQRATQYRNRTAGHHKLTRYSRPQHYAIPVRSVKLDRDPQLPVATQSSKFGVEDGQHRARESVLPTRRPPASTSVNSRSRPSWSTGTAPAFLWPSNQQQQQPQQQQLLEIRAPRPVSQEPTYQRAHQWPISRNFTAQSSLSALSHVLPNRPIFVKHLQMNGGIMLPPSNKSLQAPTSPAPLVLPASSGGGGEDLTIETSLNNAFGDIVTLPGGQQVQIQQDAESSVVEPEHASRDQRYNMLNFNAAGGEFSTAESGNNNRDQPPNSLQGDPNVIFEAAPGALDDDDRPSFFGDAHLGNDLESLLASDDQQLMSLNSDQFSMSQTAPSFIIDSNGHFDAGDKSLLANHYKPPVSSALDYATLLLNHGPGGFGGAGAAASIVIPAVQQTFARFLRFPRVFSQAYRQSPQPAQVHQHFQMQPSQHQFITTALPPPGHTQFQLKPSDLAWPNSRQLQRQLQQQHNQYQHSLQHGPMQPYQQHPLTLQMEESRVTPLSDKWRPHSGEGSTFMARGIQPYGGPALISDNRRPLPQQPRQRPHPNGSRPAHHHNRYHYKITELNDLMTAASKVPNLSVVQPPPGAMRASAATPSPVGLLPASGASLVALNSTTSSRAPLVVAVNSTDAVFRGRQDEPNTNRERKRRKKAMTIQGQQMDFVAVKKQELVADKLKSFKPESKNFTTTASSKFVAPQMESNNWTPSNGVITYFRPKNVTQTSVTPGGNQYSAGVSSGGLIVKASQQHPQQSHSAPQNQHFRWFTLPYGTMQPPKKLATSGASLGDQSLLAFSKVLPEQASSYGQVGKPSVGKSAPPPTLAPMLVPASLQITVSPIQVTSTGTPKVPFFGQRIIASFKSKLNTVGK